MIPLHHAIWIVFLPGYESPGDRIPPAIERPIDFAADVAPLLRDQCLDCHGPETQEAGLRLDLAERAAAGGDSGAAYVAGNGAGSELIRRVAGVDPDLRMPPQGEPLSAEQVGILRAWIDQGADWKGGPLSDADATPGHWSFRSIVRSELPEVTGPGESRNPIDRFVLAKLEERGIEPSSTANRYTLIRRLSLDLLGLPPNPSEVDAFVRDPRPDAYERLVDRLLASPHFGERWGRHWLDLARYADSDGYEKDRPRPYAYRYRDWVIDAVNRDLPFDRFTIEQLAGDLLPNATLAQKMATGFHRNTLKNLEGGVDQEEFRVKATVDRVNTTGTVWLGLTVGCCECHSHKYDPLTQREYFQLFAFFNDADDLDVPAPTSLEEQAYASATRRHREVGNAITERLEAYEPQLRKNLEAWEREVGDLASIPDWRAITPVGAFSAAGANLSIGEDGSVLASGPTPERDRYTVTFELEGQGLRLLRIRATTDDSLPKKGPGRAPNGNFVLNEVTLEVSPLGSVTGRQSVKFSTASADFSQKGFPAERAIDGKPETGWAIATEKGPLNLSRTLTLTLAERIDASDGALLTLTLDQKYGGKHILGGFRVEVIDADPETIDDLPPDYVRAILAVPLEDRDEDASAKLLRWYKTVDPEAKKLREDLKRHLANRPKKPGTKAQTLVGREEPRETRIHLRGDFLRPGETVDPGVPAVLSSLSTEDRPDRLDFAEWIMASENPLTARVAVNRVWQHLFGRGIVGTPDDFGTRGETPSHPELLDWLATEFRELGWSRKRLIRLIVTSATYRQQSRTRPELTEIDPKNLLLARQNRFRASAEIVRDLSLAASGLLERRIGGPSVRPPLPAGVASLGYANQIRWNESDGADRYRRGAYIFFQRTVPYPMLMTFDSPDSNVTCVRRERSNTPLQALTLLNDPVFVECARVLGSRLAESASDPNSEIEAAFLLTLGRPPTSSERERIAELRERLRETLEESPDSARPIVGAPEGAATADLLDKAAWTLIARTLLNLDEFVTRE